MSQSTQRTRRRFTRIGSGTSLCLCYRLPQAAERLPGAQLSREARQRLRWLDYARTHSVAQTCRHFGIARSTFYRWQRRYDPHDLRSLEACSSRPRRCRRPAWTATEVEAVRQARERYPRWGKDKLAVVLRRDGLCLSVSRIGRILAALKRRRVLASPSAVCGPPAQGPRHRATRGSGPSRHHALDAAARGEPPSLHGRRSRLPVECGRGPLLRHGRHRTRLLG